MSYKRAPGYQPGVCLVNEKDVLYVENRNGNSDAKAFQNETLQRMFDVLTQQGIASKYKFRADSASHHYEVFKTLEQNNCTFYIGAKNSSVEKRFSTVKQWNKVKEGQQEMWIGETTYTPFLQRPGVKENPKTYRLLVKRMLNKTGQMNILTEDAYEYRAIITNDDETELSLAIEF